MRWILALLAIPLAATGEEDLQARLFEARDRVLPALVNVHPVMDVYQGGRRRQASAIGSGVIVSADGLVVTNFHVAGHAKKVFCTLADKTRVGATLVGGDAPTDLAVLRLDLEELKRRGGTFRHARFGGATQVGEFVIALGSPRGLSTSLTSGVISNTQRYLGDEQTLPSGEPTGMFNTWIQTDAAINPGNSGGPLVNLLGEVIGINTRAITGDGLGFAIPADVVEHVLGEIVKGGRVPRAWIGLDRGLEPLDVDAPVRGVRIGHVDAPSPAATAGIAPGDVIQAIDGQAVDAQHLDEIPPIRRRVAEAPVGAPLRLRLWRAGETRDVEVVTEELPETRSLDFDAPRFGLTVRAISAAFARQQGLAAAEGVLVTGVVGGGPAAAADLRAGDIILQVARKPVRDLAAFQELYKEIVKEKPQPVAVSIRRGATQTFRALTPSTRDNEEEDSE